MNHPCELFQDDRFNALLEYLTQSTNHSETALCDQLRSSYPNACEACVGFVVDDLLESLGSGYMFDADCVSMIIYDWLTCDDPHEPNECGSVYCGYMSLPS